MMVICRSEANEAKKGYAHTNDGLGMRRGIRNHIEQSMFLSRGSRAPTVECSG